ncbi:unnamed protein product [Candida verbasci]|uniref:Cell division control protein 73 C-terminal domain-containing protein n=1 Tax=Candida verbasci TaxID=1227364 RepID=A0A9W4XB00_9ASCO|nr:unnamed protein product [Candida verbasci]
MSSPSPLKALHTSTINNEPIIFYAEDGNTTELINDAIEVQFGNNNEKFKLDQLTNFYNEDKPQSLKSVVFCWLHDKSSIVEYKKECANYGIQDFKFLVKTELNTWLNGSTDSCQFVKEEEEEKESKAEKSSAKRKFSDPQIERISKFEIESVDHNAALRGSKNIDFSYLINDAKRFMHELKRSKPSTTSYSSSRSNGFSNGTKKKSPIIMVSPATTALLSLSNIKQFLEEGKFIEPQQLSKPNGNLVMVSHESDKIIPSGQRIMIVDNVDMFTKPEYWDRVIAIFTTGQAWQFSKYKYQKPETLFQKYPGYYLGYSSESTPKQIKEWNVNEIKVDRDKRFKDKLVVRDFWIELEKQLINKGYGK